MAAGDSLQLAHTHSSRHRAEILGSRICGCFYCLAMYPPAALVEWVDDDPSGQGQTALCARCGIDSVIGDRSGLPITAEFLAAMNERWFK